jgi:formylmethanofuran dehydrogenase subunit D
MCALPPEDWEHLAHPRGTPVLVEANGRSVRAFLYDTMPRRANIKNGAIIDLNPEACKKLGLTPPVMVKARWRWA